jgi:hypothetical protein
MKAHTSVVAGMSLVVISLSAPAALHGQQADTQQHEQHHPGAAPTTPAPPQAVQPPAQPQSRQPAGMMARMKTSGAQLDVLVKKMNAATGSARIDAIAELLTALVEDRREHESMMGGMAAKMSQMHGAGPGAGQAPPAK